MGELLLERIYTTFKHLFGEKSQLFLIVNLIVSAVPGTTGSPTSGPGPSTALPSSPSVQGRSVVEELQSKGSPTLKEIINALNQAKNAASAGSNQSPVNTDNVPSSPILNPSQLPGSPPTSPLTSALNQTKPVPLSGAASEQLKQVPGSWYIGYGPSPLSSSLPEASATKDEKRNVIS